MSSFCRRVKWNVAELGVLRRRRASDPVLRTPRGRLNAS